MDTQQRHTPDADVLIIGAGPVGLYGAYYAEGVDTELARRLGEPA